MQISEGVHLEFGNKGSEISNFSLLDINCLHQIIIYFKWKYSDYGIEMYFFLHHV